MALAQASAIRRRFDLMIWIEQQGMVARLWLDRGGARNAIPVEGWRRLGEAAGDIAASEARVCVLASRDARAFSAGADIGEFEAMRGDSALAQQFLDSMRAGIEAVAALPIPVIAAVDGGCYGAAVALAIAADIVIAGDRAKFATTPAKLGLLYPQEDIDRLQARIGPGGTALMLLSGEPLDADAALGMGLTDLRATDAGQAAEELAARIAANAPGAVRGLKAQLRGWNRGGARAAFLDRFTDPEFAERLAAFRAGG